MLLSRNRKTLKAILLSKLLSIALAGTLIIGITNANPMEPFFSGKIYSTDFLTRVIVKSPSHEALYSSRIIPFSVEVIAAKNWQLTSVKLVLYLDNLPVRIVFAQRGQYEEEGVFVNQNFVHPNSTVRVKEDGCHSLVVYAIVEYNYSHIASGQSGVVPFIVNSSVPRLEIISIEDKTYASADISLDFVVNTPVFKFAYSLDGQDKVAISGNTTLTGLHDGEHEVILFAWDEIGNFGASAPVFFKVTVPESKTFTETLIGAVLVLVSVVAVSAGLLFYFRKRRRRDTSQVQS